MQDTSATNNITRLQEIRSKINGEDIDGDKVVSTNGQSFTLVYVDATEGWIATGK